MANWQYVLFLIVPIVIFGSIGSYYYVADRRDARHAIARFDAFLEREERMERIREAFRSVDEEVYATIQWVETKRRELQSIIEENDA